MGEVPHSLLYDMIELSVTIADRFKMTPFQLYREDCDAVITLINFYLNKGAPKETAKTKPMNYDGFWDF